jgi:hypothetical protein
MGEAALDGVTVHAHAVQACVLGVAVVGQQLKPQVVDGLRLLAREEEGPGQKELGWAGGTLRCVVLEKQWDD